MSSRDIGPDLSKIHPSRGYTTGCSHYIHALATLFNLHCIHTCQTSRLVYLAGFRHGPVADGALVSTTSLLCYYALGLQQLGAHGQMPGCIHRTRSPKKQVHQTYACHFTLAGKFCKSNCEPRVFTLRCNCSTAHQSLMPTTVMHPDSNTNQRNKSLHQSHAFRVQLVNQFGACNCCYNYK